MGNFPPVKVDSLTDCAKIPVNPDLPAMLAAMNILFKDSSVSVVGISNIVYRITKLMGNFQKEATLASSMPWAVLE